MSAAQLSRLAERDAKRSMRFAGLNTRTINGINGIKWIATDYRSVALRG